MAKPLKWLLSIVALLVVLFIAAIIIVPMMVDPNDYKNEIIAQVKEQTGRDLVIEGDLGLTVSPSFQVSINLPAMTISNAAGFEGAVFAQFDSAQASAALLPLIMDKELKVGNVSLDGLKLYLTRKSDGTTNWDDLVKPRDTASLSPSIQPALVVASSDVSSAATDHYGSGGSAGTQGLQSLDIGGISASNAEIIWDDQLENKYVALSPLNLTIGAINKNRPFDFSFTSDITMKNPDISGAIEVTTTATLDLQAQQYSFNQFNLITKLTGEALPGKAFNSQLSSDVSIDLGDDSLSVENLSFNGYALSLTGAIDGRAISTAQPEFNGSLNLAQFSPKELLNTLAVELPEFENAKALTSAAAELSFTATNNTLSLKPLTANVDTIELAGDFKLIDFAKPGYRFNLAINAINLDDYKVIPPGGTSSTDASANQTTRSDQTGTSSNASSDVAQIPLIPVELLRTLDVDGKLTIGELIVSNAKMQNVELVIKGNNGNVALAPLNADFYQGKINLDSRIDARTDTPKLRVKKTLSNIQLGPLLKDVTGSDDMTGTATINADITTTGLTQAQLTNNSNGSSNFSITDGVVKKMDILTTLRTAYALYTGRPLPAQEQQGTEFSEIKATSTITNGVLRNSDLIANSPIMKATGKGYVDLPKEYVDYTMQVTLLSTVREDKETGLSEFAGKTIPYTIKGNFDQLNENASFSDLVKAKAKEKLQKELEKGKLGEKLEEKLGPGFKDLFKF